jgi:transposase
MSYTGTLNHSVFSAFVENILLDTLQEGQVLILDNARAHLHESSLEKIKNKGVKILKLPPYHPELNAIEYAWSVCKSLFRKWKKKTEEELFEAWSKALKFISPEVASNLIDKAISMI